jgi:hypothetical protein
VLSSERRYELINVQIRRFLREQETLTYRRSGVYSDLSSLSTPFFHRGEVRFEPVLEDKGWSVDQELSPISRPCQPYLPAGENPHEPSS